MPVTTSGIDRVHLDVEGIDSATAHIESCGVPIWSQSGFPGVEIQTQFKPRDLRALSLELVASEG